MAKPQLRKPKKKIGPVKAIKVGTIDYKDTATLRRVTGVSVQEQRKIAKAVKNAREMALLPYSSSAR